MELPHSGTLRALGTCARMKSRVAAPASSSVVADARIAGRRPDFSCIARTTSDMRASTSSGWWMIRSGPSATTRSSSSVTMVATSTMTSRSGSSPVISRSIHTSTTGNLRHGAAT